MFVPLSQASHSTARSGSWKLPSALSLKLFAGAASKWPDPDSKITLMVPSQPLIEKMEITYHNRSRGQPTSGGLGVGHRNGDFSAGTCFWQNERGAHNASSPWLRLITWVMGLLFCCCCISCPYMTGKSITVFPLCSQQEERNLYRIIIYWVELARRQTAMLVKKKKATKINWCCQFLSANMFIHSAGCSEGQRTFNINANAILTLLTLSIEFLKRYRQSWCRFAPAGGRGPLPAVCKSDSNISPSVITWLFPSLANTRLTSLALEKHLDAVTWNGASWLWEDEVQELWPPELSSRAARAPISLGIRVRRFVTFNKY